MNPGGEGPLDDQTLVDEYKPYESNFTPVNPPEILSWGMRLLIGKDVRIKSPLPFMCIAPLACSNPFLRSTLRVDSLKLLGKPASVKSIGQGRRPCVIFYHQFRIFSCQKDWNGRIVKNRVSHSDGALIKSSPLLSATHFPRFHTRLHNHSRRTYLRITIWKIWCGIPVHLLLTLSTRTPPNRQTRRSYPTQHYSLPLLRHNNLGLQSPEGGK